MIKNTIIKGLCAAAIIMSFAQCSNNKNNNTVVAPIALNDSNGVSIVYVRQDSLLSQYNLYKELSEESLKKEENIRATLNSKQRDLEKDAMDFQHKLDNNAYATRERAEQEQARIIKKQQELQALTDKLSAEMATETQKNMQILSDSVQNVLTYIREKYGYTMIVSDPLSADKALDITPIVVKELNDRYPAKAK